MKSNYLKLFVMAMVFITCLLWTLINTSHAQSGLLFEENFDYPDGDELTKHGWTAHSSSGSNPITVTSPGLTYTNYQSISGNAALLDNTGEDINKDFLEQSSGAVYVSFLVEINDATTGWEYFIHLGPTNMGTTKYFAKVFVKDESGTNKVAFGLDKKGNDPAVYTAFDYDKGVTYLMVLKYEFKDGINNDEVKLYIFASPNLPSSEPVTPTLGPDSDDEDVGNNLAKVALRQYNASQDIKIDGIRIGLSWADAPIPVELTSFTAIAVDKQVNLCWTTATETENLGFHIYRSVTENGEFARITTELIKGVGNSDQTHHYSYTDYAVASGKTYYYKLADVDFAGNIKFHGPISITIAATPIKYVLEQCYPNPFNPETAIHFLIKEAGKVSLRIYNLQGQLIRSLVDEEKSAGTYSIMWNGTTDQGVRIASGTYLCNLKVNGFEETKKLVFMR